MVAATPSAPLAEGAHCSSLLTVQDAIPIADPTHRFRHVFVVDSDADDDVRAIGDFRQNPPFTWSGDPTPTVAEGLRSWQ